MPAYHVEGLLVTDALVAARRRQGGRSAGRWPPWSFGHIEKGFDWLGYHLCVPAARGRRLTWGARAAVDASSGLLSAGLAKWTGGGGLRDICEVALVFPNRPGRFMGVGHHRPNQSCRHPSWQVNLRVGTGMCQVSTPAFQCFYSMSVSPRGIEHNRRCMSCLALSQVL